MPSPNLIDSSILINLHENLASLPLLPHYRPHMSHQRLVPHLPLQNTSMHHSNDRFTSNLPTSLFRYSIDYEVEQYLQEKWTLSNEQMCDINWKSFRRVIQSSTRFRQIALTKFIHNQWPVLTREFHWNRASSPMCKTCERCHENKNHIFQCSAPLATNFRTTQLLHLQIQLEKNDTCPILTRHLLNIMRQFFVGFQLVHCQHPPNRPLLL